MYLFRLAVELLENGEEGDLGNHVLLCFSLEQWGWRQFDGQVSVRAWQAG